ncbi:hypothetical protein [Pseudomonas sp.]|uniref:hypothetical protein n=1 Tax=Pseudomonas sp. TaxID=306 RepID=UPI00299E03D6|nr:hypothetical protein [Pseudomonas sp.]MDX1366809.1 hypothetical protein [Pseudomonas sp.]
MTKAKRLNPKWDTRRQLFLLSMNRCAFPNCTHNIIDQYGHFIGEICHIEAANEDGERFNPNQSNEARRHISNLLLMCPTHHKITNNVAIYDVNAIRKIKSDHENKAFDDASINELSNTFVDQEFGDVLIYPENLEGLQLSDHERNNATFFNDAITLISIIARIPCLTRSFYAHGLLRSSINDLSIGFDPRELETRLRIDANAVYHHAAILERHGLLSELDNEEYPRKLNYWFTTFDQEDNQIWLLQIIIKRFSNSPEILLDIFENLNFSHLER